MKMAVASQAVATQTRVDRTYDVMLLISEGWG